MATTISTTPGTSSETSGAPRRHSGKRRRIVAGLVLLGLGVPAIYVLRGPLFEGNFAVVDPGRVYRSAQPGVDAADFFRGLGLASMLNLRGGSPTDGYYRDELAAADRQGIDFYDLPMSATARPSRADLLRLIDLFRACRYPILIHCKSGSDRTGLAALIYRMVVLGEPPEAALSEFTVWRGHFPIFGPERLHEPINEYAAFLDRAGLSHSPDRFRSWVRDEYRSPDRPILGPESPRPGSRWSTSEREAARRGR